MPVYVSLLRGINVGGNKKIKMADLRALYASLGFTHIETLLQSGNVVFKSDLTDTRDLSRKIELAIENQLGFHSDVFVLSADRFRAAYRDNPFAGEPDRDPARLLVTFLAQLPTDDDLARLRDKHSGPEVIRLVGDVLYIYYPDGMGQSKLIITQILPKISSTGRNWNTMIKLFDMVTQLEQG